MALLTVAAWELRRIWAVRRAWAAPPVVFLSFAALIWVKHSWGRPVVDGRAGAVIEILGTSRLGLPYLIIELLLPLFGILAIFVATEGVARDYRERTRELLMACPVPTWAYVGGRYVASLLVSLGLTVILLVSVLTTGAVLHATDSAYPLPDTALALGVGAVAVVPATVLLCAVSFALGTWLPRLAVAMKLVSVIGWLGLVFLIDVIDHGGTWFTMWNPTSYGIVRVNVDRFLHAYQMSIIGLTDPSAKLAVSAQLQQQAPNLWPWAGPHAALVIVAFALVGLVAATFPRFRTVMD